MRYPTRLPGRGIHGHQRRCIVAQRADAVFGIGVGGQPLRLPCTAGRHHVLPQIHRLGRVETGIGHQALADDVGLGLLLARVAQQVNACAFAAQLAVAAAEQCAEQAHADLGIHLAGDAFVVVMGNDVADLVAEHGGQFVLIPGHGEDAGIDADLAARQREGIGLGIDEQGRFPARAAPLRRQTRHQG